MGKTLSKLPVGGLVDIEAAKLFKKIGEWGEDVDRLIAGNFTKTGSGSGSTIIVPIGALPVHTHQDPTQGGNTLGNSATAMTANGNWLFGAQVAIGTTTPSGLLIVLNAGAVSTVLATLKAVAGQTGDMLKLLNSSGQIMARFDKLGQLYLGNTAAVDNAILFMGGHNGIFAGASDNCAITWGSNGHSIGAPAFTADYIGCLGARIYTYKDPTGQYDNGYGQDGLDSWVLVNDDNVTYTIWTSLINGNKYLRCQWGGNGDMEQRGSISVKKSQHATLASTPALRLWSTGSGNPTRYMGIQAAATVTSTHTLTFPAALPATKAGIYVSSAGAITYEVTPPLASTVAAANVNLTVQGADIGTTNLVASGHTAGLYRVSAVVEDTTSDVTAGAVQATIGWTDDVGATTLGALTVPQVLTGTGRTSGVVTLYSTGAAAITYATSHTGIFGTAKYALRVRVEFLG